MPLCQNTYMMHMKHGASVFVSGLGEKAVSQIHDTARNSLNISEAKCHSPQQRSAISKACPQKGEEYQFEMSAFYKAVLVCVL